MKAKLFLDEGRLELDGTPEEIAAYVKAIVPPMPGPYFGPAQVSCTCGTTQACAVHSFTTSIPAGPGLASFVPGAVGFSAAEIGRLTSGATALPAGNPLPSTVPLRAGTGG